MSRVLLPFTFYLLPFTFYPSPISPEVIDRVLAVASGQLILLSDVTAARDLGLVTIDAVAAGDVIGAALSSLIDRALMLTEVDRYAPPEPDADSIARELQQVQARFPSRQAFDAALARSGWDEQHLREAVRQNLRIREYEDRRFAVPSPGDDELVRYYREHVSTFTRDGRLTPFADARGEIVLTLTETRHAALIAEWVAGLRRRATITRLYVPDR